MRKFGPAAKLLIILVLPLVLYMLLRLGQHHRQHLEIISPKIENPGGAPDSVYHTIGDFAFPSQTGDVITLDSLKNMIYVADVFFTTCPGICPRLTKALSKVQEEFVTIPEVKLLSISIDPTSDSIPVLRDYADQYGAIDHKWYMLTGNREDIYRFAYTQFFFSATEDTIGNAKYIHDRTLRLIDKEGRFRGRFYRGTDAQDVDSLITHIKLLLYEYATEK